MRQNIFNLIIVIIAQAFQAVFLKAIALSERYINKKRGIALGHTPLKSVTK